jgi:hypothetical protein
MRNNVSDSQIAQCEALISDQIAQSFDAYFLALMFCFIFGLVCGYLFGRFYRWVFDE